MTRTANASNSNTGVGFAYAYVINNTTNPLAGYIRINHVASSLNQYYQVTAVYLTEDI